MFDVKTPEKISTRCLDIHHIARHALVRLRLLKRKLEKAGLFEYVVEIEDIGQTLTLALDKCRAGDKYESKKYEHSVRKD